MRYKIKRLKLNNSGMTLLEAMTVVVIIGVLVSVGAANYIATSKKRALEASLMTNMRTLQIMLETYRVDWQTYPADLSELSIEATNKKYNKSVTNPYTKKTGIVDASNIWAINYFDIADSSFDSIKQNYIGRVGYKLANDPTKYFLLGYNDEGSVIQRNNVPYVVTNGG